MSFISTPLLPVLERADDPLVDERLNPIPLGVDKVQGLVEVILVEAPD